VLPWMLVSAGFPILARAARDDEARLGYALQKMFEVANVLGAFIAMGLAIAAPFAIEVVAGKGFYASVSVLRLQSCGLLTSFLMVTWTYALVSLRLYRPLLLANALAAFVAIGAAIATVAAEAALAAGALWGLRSARPALTPSLAVVPKVVVCLAAGVGVSALLPVGSLVQSFAAGAVYAALAFALRAVPPEAIAALRRKA